MGDFISKSVFCVLNNPEYSITYEHDPRGEIVRDELGKPKELERVPTEYNGLEPQQICDSVLNKWIADGDDHTGWVGYCISAEGLHHLHMVLESKKTFRPLSVLKRLYPKIHIEPTKGNKKDVEDYINKRGKFEEKGEQVVCFSQVGEIVGKQGARTDLIKLDEIKALIFDDGKKPAEIFREYPQALKSRNAVEWLYWDKRKSETKPLRDIHVTWLCGQTGSGKSYIQLELYDKYGEDNFYLVTDYINPFDNYQGEDVILIDEFRGQFRLADLLMYLQGYRQQIRARYSNKYGLWTKVFITSPVTPYELYRRDNDTSGSNDKLQQLYRRIDDIVYCFKLSIDDNFYYCRQRFPCDIDSCQERIYKQFYDRKSTVNQLIRTTGNPPRPSDDFSVSVVAKTVEEKEEEKKQAELYGVEF